MKVFLLGIFIAILSLGNPLLAQDSTFRHDSLIWDLQTCLDYAKKNNITINSLRLTSQTGEQNLLQSKASRYPNLSASVSEGISNTKSAFSPSSDYGVSSNLTIYNGGFLRNDIKEKQLSLQASNLDISTAENDISLSITQSYLNILLARENIVYLQDVVATSQAQVTQSQQRFDAGTIAKKDLLQLQAVFANDKYNLVVAENNKRQNILNLKQALQLPSEANFDIAQTDIPEPVTPPSPLASVQQTALKNRPEVKSSELGVSIANIDIEKARAGLRPILTAGGSLNTVYSRNPNALYFDQLNNNFGQQLGVNLSVPILDRRVTKSSVERAKIEVGQATLTLENTKLVLTQAIEQAYINLINAQHQFDAAKEQLNYTEEAYRIANEQLKIGVYNTVEYLQQKNLYVQAQQSYTQAKYAATLYRRIYNFYSGIPVTQQ